MSRIEANKRQTFLLLICFFFVVVIATTAVAILLDLPLGASPLIVIGTLVFAAFAYFGSDSVALAVSGAREEAAERHAADRLDRSGHGRRRAARSDGFAGRAPVA